MNPFQRGLTANGPADSISRVRQLFDFVFFIEGFRGLLLQWVSVRGPAGASSLSSALPKRLRQLQMDLHYNNIGRGSQRVPRMARKVAPAMQELDQLFVDSCESSWAKRLLPAAQLRSKETAPPEKKHHVLLRLSAVATCKACTEHCIGSRVPGFSHNNS